ncbi:enoyl-CoA hydratase/isomerase family protein [Hoyosella subflava]|uniref:3-hydroxyisobutyryl-CoA hydrolase n=1 Tax=Hoyosella subflava (strain DSM 45089 / JCM 17490 / NBRC 109087 / DQS3-9A1) TaxID=443218 RepID=F6EFK8_HOYSD|nr:enoyl-CoA hydratase/isomerase family protein [Hoyosella subflava]AEF40937.1 Enoyl-CoA hydratase/isomerase family protein [Hoyosella subflava DQS3-9A1]
MSDVLIEKSGRLGLITLNRPAAINSLNHDMVRDLAAALASWEHDDSVRAVAITGAGERGLCAGGDIVAIHRDAQGDGSQTKSFWRDEYILNEQISTYAKPYVALMDGIVMGGGVGVSAHGSVRIVTERSRIGMPEVGIGFVPDVGGTYLLARAPGELGTHIALTTARLTAGDAVVCGFADHFVPSAELGALLEALSEEAPDEVIARFAQPAPESELHAQREWIDSCYSAETVEEIVARLERNATPEAGKAAQQILSKSPTALKVALRSLRSARRSPSLAVTLNEEYRVSLACLRSPDLVEGIRAQVIDKDRNPQWSPARLEDVSDDRVATFFRDLGDEELGLS